VAGKRRQPESDLENEETREHWTIEDLREPWRVEAFLDGLAFAREQAQAQRAIEAAAAAKALRWETSVQGFEELLRMAGVSEPDAGDAVETVRGGEAVLTVMRENERIWTAREVHEELERRGWTNLDVSHPLRGTEAAINRLWKAEKIEKLSRGRYRAKP
jgi:hypothetical protein